MIDIKIFTYGGARGAGKGRAGGVIRSEKLENHKNSAHTEIKFNVIYIFIFPRWILKILQMEGGRQGGRQGGRWNLFF